MKTAYECFIFLTTIFLVLNFISLISDFYYIATFHIQAFDDVNEVQTWRTADLYLSKFCFFTIPGSHQPYNLTFITERSECISKQHWINVMYSKYVQNLHTQATKCIYLSFALYLVSVITSIFSYML